MEKIINFFREEDGATAVEYAIMVALIAVVILLTVTYLGSNIESTYNQVGKTINDQI